MYEMLAQKDCRVVPFSCSAMDWKGVSIDQQRGKSWRAKAYWNRYSQSGGVEGEDQDGDVDA